MIWIIGGTSEASILAKTLNEDNIPYIMSIATEDGKEFFKNCNLRIGRMNKEDMQNFCIAENITSIADISHPYAVLVSQNAKEVSVKLGISYFKFLRTPTSSYENIMHFKNIEEVCSFLASLKNSVVFFTTGSKNIIDFEPYRMSNRFVYRILPTVASIENCKLNNVKTQDIIACLGPFSKALNIAMFKDYKANYIVLKDSGTTGGTKEKLEACAELKITPLMIDRQNYEGIDNIKKILNAILENEKAK